MGMANGGMVMRTHAAPIGTAWEWRGIGPGGSGDLHASLIMSERRPWAWPSELAARFALMILLPLLRDKVSHTLTCMLCHAIGHDIYQRVCMTLCICHFRSWTSGESHHVNVDLVVIDAVVVMAQENARSGPIFALVSTRMYRRFVLPRSLRIFSSVWLRYQ